MFMGELSMGELSAGELSVERIVRGRIIRGRIVRWANCPWANCPRANCPLANCPVTVPKPERKFHHSSSIRTCLKIGGTETCKKEDILDPFLLISKVP